MMGTHTKYKDSVEFVQNNFSLPQWAQKVFGTSDFMFISFYQLLLNTATTEMKRLKSGFLLKEIFDRFTNKSQSTLSPDRSLWMYFGHETTIANMLNTLGLYTEVKLFSNSIRS